MNRGAFDAADLPQGSRQFVLARVRGELAQDLAGPHGPGGHGGRDAQDVRPVPVDQVDVHLAADQRAQELSRVVRDTTREATPRLAPWPTEAVNWLVLVTCRRCRPLRRNCGRLRARIVKPCSYSQQVAKGVLVPPDTTILRSATRLLVYSGDYWFVAHGKLMVPICACPFSYRCRSSPASPA